jgi:hypothetical protein
VAKKKAAGQGRLFPTPKGPPLKLPAGEALDIEPGRLLLDPANLRLYDVARELQETPARLIGQSAVQEKLQQVLMDEPRFDIESLIMSIASNGFLKHDRLIVARYDAERYLTLEGNRRLTAVRTIMQKHMKGVSPDIRQSIDTLPCFVLKGDLIDGSEVVLKEYRRASEIYIGIRHLMGARSWEPASRYEFQARLIRNENWTPEQVAERFGRNKNDVIRELEAQQLYQDFLAFEKQRKSSHRLTYNAFAEAVRAKAISDWLGWSKQKMAITNKENERAFFEYLVHKLPDPRKRQDEDSESLSPDESAETIVRNLRDMLKLGDEDIVGALADKQFDSAELLYEDRRTGKLAKRLTSYIRSLRRISASELMQDAKEHKRLLDELIAQSQRLSDLLSNTRRRS